MFVCVFFFCSCSPPPPAHTLQPTHWPLPLSAGWLPRLQCRLSSSCCYETRTDRPELNDNVSVALARGPKQPIRDGLDKHFPNLGSGDLRLIVWDGRSLLSHLRRSLLALFFISSSFVSVRKCASHCLLNGYEGDKNIAQVKKDPCYTKGDSDNIHIYNSYIYINNGSMNMSNLKSASSSDKPTPPVDIKSCCKVTRTQQKR